MEEATAYANSVLVRFKIHKLKVLFVLLDGKVLLPQVTYAVSHKQSMTKNFQFICVELTVSLIVSFKFREHKGYLLDNLILVIG